MFNKLVEFCVARHAQAVGDLSVSAKLYSGLWHQGVMWLSFASRRSISVSVVGNPELCHSCTQISFASTSEREPDSAMKRHALIWCSGLGEAHSDRMSPNSSVLNLLPEGQRLSQQLSDTERYISLLALHFTNSAHSQATWVVQ